VLVKSLEFKHQNGQKVKVIEIPVLEKTNSYHFMLGIRLQSFLTRIYENPKPLNVYSFKDYLKKVLKWHDYEQLFKTEFLKYNA